MISKFLCSKVHEIYEMLPGTIGSDVYDDNLRLRIRTYVRSYMMHFLRRRREEKKLSSLRVSNSKICNTTNYSLKSFQIFFSFFLSSARQLVTYLMVKHT